MALLIYYIFWLFFNYLEVLHFIVILRKTCKENHTNAVNLNNKQYIALNL